MYIKKKKQKNNVDMLAMAPHEWVGLNAQARTLGLISIFLIF
jgi:hypothetical protein